MNEPFFIEGFNDVEDIFSQFNASDIDGVDVLYAYYSYENCEGYAWVLFERGGQFYEVNGSHCSCYGLENQWEPEVVTLEALNLRLEQGNLGRCPNVREFIESLSVWDLDEPASEVIAPKKARGKSVLKFRKNSTGRPKRDYLI